MPNKTNAGYEIIQEIRVMDAVVVLGYGEGKSSPYVTWEYYNNSYFWGHYFDDEFKAQKDLVKRASEKVAIFDTLQPKPKEREAR